MRSTIETERLVLRPITNEDAPNFAKLGNDRDIARMTGSFPYPFPLISVEVKIMMLNAQKRRGIGYPYAITKDGGDLMGVTDLFRKDETTPFEIGYWIGKPFWGKGYMTEACEALVAEAERTLGANKFVAGVFADNLGSMRVLEKLGFKRVGEVGKYFSMARLKKADNVSFLREGVNAAI